MRFLSLISCSVSGVWWILLMFHSASTLGAPLARHSIRFLIPEDYLGWIEIRYGVSGSPPLPLENGSFVCSIPDSGVLPTSSKLEEGWATDEYYFLAPDDSLLRVYETPWGGGGYVWDRQVRPPAGAGSSSSEKDVYLYIGTEDQFTHGVTKNGLEPPG